MRVDRHVREVHSGVLGTLDRAPVRPSADFAVLHGATDVNDARRPRRRINRHVVRALSSAVVKRRESGRAVRRVG